MGGYFGLGGRLSGRSNILHFFSFRSLLGGFSRRFFVFSLVRYFLSRLLFGSFFGRLLVVTFVITVDQFDQPHFGGVADTLAQFVDTCVTAVALGELSDTFVKKLGHGCLVADAGDGETTVVELTCSVVSFLSLLR